MDTFAVYLSWPASVLFGALFVLLGRGREQVDAEPSEAAESADSMTPTSPRLGCAPRRTPTATIHGDGTWGRMSPGRPSPSTSGPAARSDSGGPPARGRRTVLVAGAAVAVVAAVGVGAYGVVQLMSGGSSPATAVPADAVGYVSLDLDPSASQKIEAIKILRKFPAIKKQLGSRDDLRKAVFDELRKSGDCTGGRLRAGRRALDRRPGRRGRRTGHEEGRASRWWSSRSPTRRRPRRGRQAGDL